MGKKQHKIYVSDDTWEKTEKLAKLCGKSKSAYIETLLNFKVPKGIPPREYYKLYLGLSKIGNNINQMAKLSHTTGNVDYKKFEEDLKMLAEIKKSVKELAMKEVNLLE